MSEAQLKRSTECITIYDSILSKLGCCSEGLTRLKEHITRRSCEMYLEECDSENTDYYYTLFI